MPTYVAIDGAAGTTNDSTRSVDIGSGTNRKALAFWAQRDSANNNDTYNVTFDPGGANQAAFTQAIALQFDLWGGDAYYKTKAFYYDIPNGLSGATSILFDDDDATGCAGAAWIVVVLSDCASGAPEATMPKKTIDTATQALTSISDSITTITANAMIVAFAYGAKTGFTSGTSGEWTPDNGQTEVSEYNLTSSVGAVAGRLDKASPGAQTIGWSFTDAAGRGVVQSMLLAIAPATSVTHYTVTELTISATAD